MAVMETDRLLKLLKTVENVKGDFAEIGVFRGHTFKRLSIFAKRQGKVAHGFDSFEGMDDPTDHDCGFYEKGRLACSFDDFLKGMNEANIDPDAYELFQGFIPHCFDGIKPAQRYSYALVDVDQYKPTRISLRWIWQRLNLRGLLVVDDYFKNRQRLATKAIDEWLKTLHPLDFRFIELSDSMLVIRKQHIPDNLEDK